MLGLELSVLTPPQWVEVALRDFDSFLLDHASCERKASAVGMSFVVRYPDRTLLLDPMIQFAREELEHFHQVYRLVAARGLSLGHDEPDEYVNRILRHVRTGREERFLDRLLVSSLIEARGHERLTLVAERIEDPKLKQFYARLSRAESHHKDLFLEIALLYFPESTVKARLAELNQEEALAIKSVPFRSALH
jgi:tRNA 2-(methylsulfanyl)-N6-isopentenyladenosine37 hydroxylase